MIECWQDARRVGLRAFHDGLCASNVERTPTSVPPGPRGPGYMGAYRIVECTRPYDLDDLLLAWAKAHATGTLVHLALLLGLVTVAVGCKGDLSEPAVSEPVAPVTVAPQVAEMKPAARDAVVLGVPDPASDPAWDDSRVAVAREAFRVLITPGSDPAAWEAAQKQMVDLGPDAIPVMLGGLASKNAIERETAATVCALIGAEDARLQAALLKCLSDESSFVRANAAAALAQVPEYQSQVMATLTDLLADSDPQLRRMAAANLGSFGEEASAELPKLTAVLTDDDAEVVTPVIQLLGRIGPLAVEAVPQLQKIAFEEDGDLKLAAEQALLLIQSDSPNPLKPSE